MNTLLLISSVILATAPIPAIEPTELAGALGSGVQVVDLRGELAYERSHIVGATPRSPWALSRDGALRRQTLVVVDAGLPGGPADQLVATLSARGVRIRALRGGFRAWCEAGLPTSAPCGRVDVVSPAEVVGRPVVSASDAAPGAVALPPPGPLPAPRPGVFWLEGGDAALAAMRSPAPLGSAARALLSKPSGSPIATDASSCGCQR